MPSRFPGMDPYLENPVIFPDLHDRLIANLSEALQAVFDRSYDTGPYRRRVRYSEAEITPPLSATDSEWAKGLLGG